MSKPSDDELNMLVVRAGTNGVLRATSLCTIDGANWTLRCIDDPHGAAVLPPNGAPVTARVPGCVQADLKSLVPDPNFRANSLHPVFERLEYATFEYECKFVAPHSPKQQLLLVFEAIDTHASVAINGHHLFKAGNAFHQHNILVSPTAICPGKCNTLTVTFEPSRAEIERQADSHTYREWNDPVGGISRVRTPQYKAGWDWGPRIMAIGITAPLCVYTMDMDEITVRIADVSGSQSHSESIGEYVRLDILVAVDATGETSMMRVRCALELKENAQEKAPDNDGNWNELQLEEGENDEDVGAEMWCGFTNRKWYAGSINITAPLLWWPNDMGEQPLYQLTTQVEHSRGGILANHRELIGLRELKLIREEGLCDKILGEDDDDTEVGESFIFAVNGRRFFAKGANYIPMNSLYTETKYEEYESVISSATFAHMNILRVWGGGIYERSDFYDLCDRNGILLWHDFMYSCSLYPGDDEFLASCAKEARYQVTRLRNRTCLALWCGNNELEQVPHDITADTARKTAYDQLFYNILPGIVERYGGGTPYWPSSPHNPRGYERGFNNPYAGDTHFWDVWHARKPVGAYLSHQSRFCSEFGMQSFLSFRGARAFSDDLNPFGPTMEAHQKNAAGNLIIQEYCQRLFRAPRDYAAMVYQSQLNQAHCMRVGVEHFRREWPYCAGALYWQLQDCWPCVSWSSIEYGGQWKALHYAAEKFFNPILVSIVHLGGVKVGVCNLTSFGDETGVLKVYAHYDGTEPMVEVALSCSTLNVQTDISMPLVDKKLKLLRDEVQEVQLVDVRGKEFEPTSTVLRVEMVSVCEKYRSSATGWMCAPRLYKLKQPDVRVKCTNATVGSGKTAVVLKVCSSVFAPFVQLSFSDEDKHKELDERYYPPVPVNFSNNYFDLFPNETVEIRGVLPVVLNEDKVVSQIHCMSLVDSYMR